MASIFEIDAQIMDCVDPDTGEIIDSAKLEALQIERETKIENVALWVKNLRYEAQNLKAEKDALAEREKAAKRKIESLESYLETALAGQGFETPKVKVSFRKSKVVEITDERKIPEEYVRTKVEKSPDKIAIKEALKNNFQIPGAFMKEKTNIQIK